MKSSIHLLFSALALSSSAAMVMAQYTFPTEWTCPSTGFLQCDPGHPRPVIDGQGSLLTASLSNCVYHNCPSITVTNGSVLTLSNVTFSSNNTYTRAINYNYRGALVFIDGGRGNLSNVVFSGLLADYGAAMSIYYDSEVTIKNGMFVRLRTKVSNLSIYVLALSNLINY